MLKAPFPWFGGKSRAIELVWPRLGNVLNYVEPFAGSLAMLLGRPHDPSVETVNDRDCYLSNFWRSITTDPLKVARYADWPVSECDLRARHRWLCQRKVFRERMLQDPHYHDAKIAGWWVWGISQWIGAGWCSRPEWIGRGQGGRAPRGLNASIQLSSTMGVHVLDGMNKRPVINRGSRGVTNPPHQIQEWMIALFNRLRNVRVCCGDWARILTPSCTWKLGGGQLTAVFLDPPYAHAMRDKRLYSIEADISAEVRTWAVANGGNPRLRIALCGLAGEHEMPAGWEMASWHPARGYSKKARRREVIWFSPACLKQENLFTRTECEQ